MGNNPIKFSDFLGDTVRGVNEKSANLTKYLILGTFVGKGRNNLRYLFEIGKDGVTFNTIV